MVESDSDSMSHLSSHGKRVPRPNCRLQAHWPIQSTVCFRALIADLLYISKFVSTWRLTRSVHSSSLYVRYHWSTNATMHSSPLREITWPSGSKYLHAWPALIRSWRTSGLASRTDFPLYG